MVAVILAFISTSKNFLFYPNRAPSEIFMVEMGGHKAGGAHGHLPVLTFASFPLP